VALGIPTIASVVSHLVLHVLSESQLGRIHTALGHEKENSGNEVAESFVVDQFLKIRTEILM
jgi:hypothetical protein